MIQNKKTFKLDNEHSIEFQLQDSCEAIHCCSEAQISLIEPTRCALLSSDSLRHNLQIFEHQLTKALHNELILHESLKDDIGYLYNQELQEKPGLSYKKWQGVDQWGGQDYMLWEGILVTWLYNNVEGSIILEATPVYPGNFMLPEEQETYQAYDEWIRNYSPYLIQTIPKKTAEKWLELTKKILAHIEENVKKEFAN